jgi:hypothetical protein
MLGHFPSGRNVESPCQLMGRNCAPGPASGARETVATSAVAAHDASDGFDDSPGGWGAAWELMAGAALAVDEARSRVFRHAGHEDRDALC